MARYIICPRCELNFIDADSQEYCDVCLKELSGAKTFADDFEEVEAMEETELCPICGENYMKFGEDMCEICKRKSAYEDDIMDDDEDKEDDTWRSYLDDEDEELEDLGIPDSEFDDEEEEEEEEEVENYEDDFEYVSAEDYDPDDDDDDDFEDDEFEDEPRAKKHKKDDDDF